MRSIVIAALICTACATTSTRDSIEQVKEIVATRTGTVANDADRAAQLALANNRALSIAQQELGVAQAQRAASYALPNPRASGTIRFPTAADRRGTNLEGAISIDLLGLVLVPVKASAANRMLEAKKLALAHRMLKTALEAKIAFYRAQAIDALIAIESTAVETERLAMDFAERQHQAGTLNDLDLAEQKIAYQEAALELVDLQVERDAVRGRLARITGAEVAGKLPALLEPPAHEARFEQLEAKRLDLEAAHAEEEAAQKAITVAELRRIPSIHAGVSAEHELDGDTVVGPELELELPIFDPNRGEIAEREAQARTATARIAELEERIARETALAKARFTAARKRAEYWAKEVIPARAHAVELAQQHYNLGTLGVYDLLRIKKREVDARKKKIEAVRDYWIARTELERALGVSIGRP